MLGSWFGGILLLFCDDGDWRDGFEEWIQGRVIIRFVFLMSSSRLRSDL